MAGNDDNENSKQDHYDREIEAEAGGCVLIKTFQCLPNIMRFKRALIFLDLKLDMKLA